MDGTLVDSEHHWMASEKALAEAHNAVWTEQDGQHGVPVFQGLCEFKCTLLD
jgi:beta-phosphoglucomutase-like phosphatase (HAD superfamily)